MRTNRRRARPRRLRTRSTARCKASDQSAANPGCVRAIARNIRGHPVSARRRGRLDFIRQSRSARRWDACRAGSSIFSGSPDIGASFPVTIEGEQAGDIVFSPDISADIYEKWIGFLAIVSSAIALMLLTGIIAYFTTRAVLASAAEFGRRPDPHAQGRLRTPDSRGGTAGDTQKFGGGQRARPHAEAAEPGQSQPVAQDRVAAGRRTPRHGARTSRRTRPVAVWYPRQRRRAAGSHPAARQIEPAVNGMLEAVEALQQANRRILDRLRPLYIQELGLEKSIQTLLHNARSQAPNLKLTSQIDARLNEIDGLLSQTVYRVIQEGVTNVLRHANAHSMNVAGDDRRRPTGGRNFRRWHRSTGGRHIRQRTDGNARAR